MSDHLVQSRLPARTYRRFRTLGEKVGLSDAALLRMLITLVCDAEVDPELERIMKVPAAVMLAIRAKGGRP